MATAVGTAAANTAERDRLVTEHISRVRLDVRALLLRSEWHRIDDLTQDCLVRLLEMFERFDPAIASFSTWRRHIVRRVVLDDRRNHRRRAERPVPDLMGHPNDFGPEENAIRAESAERLAQVLAAAPRKQRAAFRWMLERLPAPEVARRLKISEGQVRSLQSKAQWTMWNHLRKERQAAAREAARHL